MTKEFYPLGQAPQIGVVPKFMLAHCIRQNRFGEPKEALQIEKVEVPSDLEPYEVLVYVMAAGVNYNVAWACSGGPVDVINYCHKGDHPDNFNIPGSDATGIVWKTGSAVTKVKVGDEVIIHGCRWDYDDPHIKSGKDPGLAPTLHMWGYETIYGGLAQYTRVHDNQCLRKPKHLPWASASSLMVNGAAAYRMLHHWSDNIVQPGDPVLIWGGSGGLGCMGIQICKAADALPVAVVSDPDKEDFCRNLGAVGVINRNDFNHWGVLPHWKNREKYQGWVAEARRFGRSFWEALGEARNPAIVFEHPGEATLPTSCFLVEIGGMVVICAGTSGYNATLDLRYHWMRQKRLQGSHFANNEECSAFLDLVDCGKVDPCLSQVYPFENAAEAHQLMFENKHPPGNMGVLVNASNNKQKHFND